MFQICLFGSGQAKYGNRDLPGFPHQRASLLLCYLLLHRKYPHHRERLAAMFWGDYSSHSARKQLRNALWGLRQNLQAIDAPPDEFLLTEEEYVSFISTSRCWLDIDVFEDTVQRYQNIKSQSLSLDQANQLEKAADLYIGDLLEGIYEDWCLYDRERLRLMYQDTLNKLLVFHTVNGRYARALGFGQRLLSLDNTLEAVHRQLMCLHWLAGERASALSQYKLYSQILREELNTAPMEETRNLYNLLRDGNPPSFSRILSQYFQLSSSAPSRNELTSTQQLLQKLNRLQETIDSTSAELHQIQDMLNQVLSTASHL